MSAAARLIGSTSTFESFAAIADPDVQAGVQAAYASIQKAAAALTSIRKSPTEAVDLQPITEARYHTATNRLHVDLLQPYDCTSVSNTTDELNAHGLTFGIGRTADGQTKHYVTRAVEVHRSGSGSGGKRSAGSNLALYVIIVLLLAVAMFAQDVRKLFVAKVYSV